MTSQRTTKIAVAAGTHFVSPKLDLRLRPEIGGCGVFCVESIRAGELVVMWGGDVLTGDQLEGRSMSDKRLCIQVEEDLYLVPHLKPETGDFVNHSCDPNLGLSGQIGLVAMRNIEPGEEVCYDYAMSDGSDYDEFICSCDSHVCRGRVTGSDWQLADLQERYEGYFSPYLQRRILNSRKTQFTPMRHFGVKAL